MNGTLWRLPASVSSGFLLSKSVCDDFVVQFIRNKNFNVVNSMLPLFFILSYKLFCFSSIAMNMNIVLYAFVHNLSVFTIEKSKSLISHEPNAMIIQSLNIIPTTMICYYTSPQFDLRISAAVILTNGAVYSLWFYNNQYTQISNEDDTLGSTLLDDVKRRNYLFLAILSMGLFSVKDYLIKQLITQGISFIDILFSFYLFNLFFTVGYCRIENHPLLISYVDDFEKVSNNLKATLFSIFSIFCDFVIMYNYLAAASVTNNIVYPRILENNRLFVEIPVSYIVHDKTIHSIQLIGCGLNSLSLFVLLYFGRS